jgi:hypothetical protein
LSEWLAKSSVCWEGVLEAGSHKDKISHCSLLLLGNLRNRSNIFCYCHLGAIAAKIKWGGGEAGEGVTRERPSMAGGGGKKYKGLGCTLLNSVHTNSTWTRGGGGGAASQHTASWLADPTHPPSGNGAE